jgi:hypothetical protein
MSYTREVNMKKDKKVVPAWVDKWCLINVKLLLQDEMFWFVAVHPEHGLLFSDSSVRLLNEKLVCLRRSIRRDVVCIDVETTFERLGLPKAPCVQPSRAKPVDVPPKVRKKPAKKPGDKPDPFNGLPDLRPLAEPDHDVILDGSQPQPLDYDAIDTLAHKLADSTLQLVAKRLGKKSVDVLLKLLSRENHRTELNVNCLLTPDEIAFLEEEYGPKLPDAAKASPDPQPPFQPHPAPSPRDTVVDGGGAVWRNQVRFD